MLTLYMNDSEITQAESTQFGLNFLKDTFDRNQHAFPQIWNRGIIQDNQSRIVWDSDAENVASIIDQEIWND